MTLWPCDCDIQLLIVLLERSCCYLAMSRCFGNSDTTEDVECGVPRRVSSGCLPCTRSGQISPLQCRKRSETQVRASSSMELSTPSIERRPVNVNGAPGPSQKLTKPCGEVKVDIEGEDELSIAELGQVERPGKDHSQLKRRHSSLSHTGEEEDHFDDVDQEITPLGRILRPRHAKDPSGRLNSIFIPPSKPSLFCFPNIPKRQGIIAPRIKSWLEPTNSPVNVKLFGSKQAVKQEQIRTRMSGWIIHPCSTLRHYWDIVMLLILVCNMIVLPVAITFINADQAPFWIGFNVVSDVSFVLDIGLNFRTGFMVHNSYNQFILSPKLIAKRYIHTWFFLDLLSSLPLDYIVASLSAQGPYGVGLTSASRALKFLRLAKLLSLLRLLRVTRLLRSISQYEELFHITTSFVRYIKLVSMMFLVAHWNGCLSFLVPYLQDFPKDSWVAINELQLADWTTQYSWALFKALSHMLCIGYGRFPPANLSEAYITIFSMITGATFYALFIAHSMTFMQQLDSARRMYMEKFKQIEEYMSYRKLPAEIREKLSEYYEHRYQGKLFDEGEILDEISKPLRELIVSHNCRDLIDSVPFFRDGSPQFVATILTKLKFEVYLPGDYIITEGAFGTEMFFIRQGLVDIIVNEECVTTLSEGAYFGEICLLTNARRVASVKAVTVCDLFVLSADCFNAVLEEFPEMKVLIEHVAVERLQKIGRSAPNLGDTPPQSPTIVVNPSGRDASNQASSHLLLANVEDFVGDDSITAHGSIARMEDLVMSHRDAASSCRFCKDGCKDKMRHTKLF